MDLYLFYEDLDCTLTYTEKFHQRIVTITLNS